MTRMINHLDNQTEISFHNQGNTLCGTLSLPIDGISHPAIVMLQGSGGADRTNDNYFPTIRDYFVSQGIAVLCYDKPGTGCSSGNWQCQSFADRAQEALSAVSYLQQHSEINPQKVGLWGHSQGAWIVFLAASKSKDVAFVISNSGSGVSPLKQDRYGLEKINRAAGEGKSNINQALRLYDDMMHALSIDKDFEDITTLIATSRNSAWDRYFAVDFGLWSFLKRNFDYDPVPALQRTMCPVLALFGEQDLLVPVKESISVFEKELAKAKNSDVTIQVFPNADHRVRINKASAFAEGYFETQGEWLRLQIEAGYKPHVSDAQSSAFH